MEIFEQVCKLAGHMDNNWLNHKLVIYLTMLRKLRVLMCHHNNKKKRHVAPKTQANPNCKLPIKPYPYGLKA